MQDSVTQRSGQTTLLLFLLANEMIENCNSMKITLFSARLFSIFFLVKMEKKLCVAVRR